MHVSEANEDRAGIRHDEKHLSTSIIFPVTPKTLTPITSQTWEPILMATCGGK